MTNKFLITKFRNHGDVLTTTPIFKTIKEYDPNATVDCLIFSDSIEMVSGNDYIDNIFTINRNEKNIIKKIIANIKLTIKLKENNYTHLIHTTESMRGLWIKFFCSIPHAVTFNNNKRDKLFFWRRSFQSIPNIKNRHVVDKHLDLLRSIGIKPTSISKKMSLKTDNNFDDLITYLDIGIEKNDYILIHPTSRWMFKCWPAESFAKLIDKIAAHGKKIVVSSSPDEKELKFIAEIEKQTNLSFINISGKTSLKQLSELINHASMLITVDSVPMHIASAVNTPVIAIFGPSGENEWGPWMVDNIVIKSEQHPCRPCGKDGCGRSKVSDCLTEISVQTVLNAYYRLEKK
ncbi:putative lipopolysaccharide heptosyltransferase III [Plesiomonas shigelloides]|uniref:putative lipopolysaccharide heptosyltransferase III n=1 Tax=Plesiomonas shigelloides TaxID=703 RepID=UPI001262111F|nr:putative lipopolysaccharide heptosyltransferase III [Plesiomonas shigelloides]KAB7692150.1 putative lipopolysaccharide heptosyltransferase III [Plesiomonas shigelloides]